MRHPIQKIKAHVYRNRGKYAFVAGLSVAVAIENGRAKQINKFLVEHDLVDEYYQSEEE